MSETVRLGLAILAFLTLMACQTGGRSTPIEPPHDEPPTRAEVEGAQSASVAADAGTTGAEDETGTSTAPSEDEAGTSTAPSDENAEVTPSLGESLTVPAEAPESDTDWEVLAFSYGRSRYKLSALVHGEEAGRHPMGWFFWALRKEETFVLVDTGFVDRDKAKQWGIKGFRTAAELLAELGVALEEVDHVILTHGHWDHVGGLGQFPAATVWIREREYNGMERRVGDDGARSAGGFRRGDFRALRQAHEQGRLELLGSGRVEVLPGIEAYDEGKHTSGIQWLAVQSGGKTVVLASDTAYLYRNIEEPVAIGSSSSAEGNLAAIKAMRATASEVSLIVPGHDPEVAERFPELVPGVVRVSGE